MEATAIGAAGQVSVYLDEPYASVRWEEGGKWVVVEWKAWANSADFRAVQETAIRAVEEHAATRFLADTRNLKLVVSADERWVREDWIPRLALAGVVWSAIVTPANQLARLILADITKIPRPGGERLYFETLAEARHWLSGRGTPEAGPAG